MTSGIQFVLFWRRRVSWMLGLALFLGPVLGYGDTALNASKLVDRFSRELETGKDPETIFSISIPKALENEVRVIWLDPIQWLPSDNQNETRKYIGFLAYSRIKAPFDRVFHTVTAFRDEPKFTPGVISTDVLEWKRVSETKSSVTLIRRRKLPLFLAGMKDARYQIQGNITSGPGWTVIRAKLVHPSGKKLTGGLLEVMEGFEYIKSTGAGETIYVAGAFAMPDTGIVPIRRSAASEKSEKPRLVPLSLGLDKIKETLDVGGQLYEKIVGSVLDGAFETTAALVQVTTDGRWNQKRVYQLTKNESETILHENGLLLKKAKKNRWIAYPEL